MSLPSRYEIALFESAVRVVGQRFYFYNRTTSTLVADAYGILYRPVNNLAENEAGPGAGTYRLVTKKADIMPVLDSSLGEIEVVEVDSGKAYSLARQDAGWSLPIGNSGELLTLLLVLERDAL